MSDLLFVTFAVICVVMALIVAVRLIFTRLRGPEPSRLETLVDRWSLPGGLLVIWCVGVQRLIAGGMAALRGFDVTFVAVLTLALVSICHRSFKAGSQAVNRQSLQQALLPMLFGLLAGLTIPGWFQSPGKIQQADGVFLFQSGSREAAERYRSGYRRVMDVLAARFPDTPVTLSGMPVSKVDESGAGPLTEQLFAVVDGKPVATFFRRIDDKNCVIGIVTEIEELRSAFDSEVLQQSGQP
ncbi:MAG: hypothetical protein ACK58L_10315 [Planctomycetota bacterium]